MKNIFKILIVLLVFALSACEEKANQWDVDPSYDGLFRSLVFDVSNAAPTSVTLKFTKCIGATKYIFEFSKDSLEFNEIVMETELLADTLTPFAESSTLTRVEYRTKFTGLDGETGYSVRMKTIDEDSGLESEYAEVYFKTTKEQIIETVLSYADRIELTWTQTDDLTQILVTNESTGEETSIDLTSDQIANAAATIENLGSGTTYTIQLLNGTAIRGEESAKTSGIEGGYVIRVEPTDTLSVLFREDSLALIGKSLTLIFEGGNTYEIGSFTIPTGVLDLSVSGEISSDGSYPVLELESVSITDNTIGSVMFESVELSGSTSNYLISWGGGASRQVDKFVFTDCSLSNYRAIVRIKSDNACTVGKIQFEDCTTYNTGGYGIINVASNAESTVDTLSFNNCTLADFTTQIMDIRIVMKLISLTNCTMCNLVNNCTQFFRLEEIPENFVFENNIVAGNNGGAEVKCFGFESASGDIAISLPSSYCTSDFYEVQRSGYEFTEITQYSGTTYDLFNDPDNLDFSIKSGAGFAGEGVAGDTRWY